MFEMRNPRLAGLFLIIACWIASAPQITLADEDSRFPRITLSGHVVDEAGQPVVGAMVFYRDYKDWRSRTGLDGNFSISIRDTSFLLNYYMFELLARTDDGRLGVLASISPKRLDPVRIVVKPPRPIHISVIDREGRPIAGADVRATADRMEIFEGITGMDGGLTFLFPTDATRASVVALKSKMGIALMSNQPNSGVAAPIQPLSDSLVLKLEGARPPLRIKAVDARGEPLSELTLTIGPSIFAGVARYEGLGRLGAKQTGKDGVAVFDWLPKDLGETIPIFTQSEAYHQPTLGNLSTSIETNQNLPHIRGAILTGRIKTADGLPVAGAVVKAAGFGLGGIFSRGFPAGAYTDSDGRYSMLTNSNLAYVIVAEKGDLIAVGETYSILRPGERTEVGDLILRPGTWMHGTVTSGRNAIPVSQELIRASLDRGNIPAEVHREVTKAVQRMSINFSDRTDATGRYRIHLAPGKYDLRGPRNVPYETITIPAENPPAEFFRDYNLPES
jgi:hypothetical protein